MILLALALYFVLCVVLITAGLDRIVSRITGYPPIFRLCARWRKPGRWLVYDKPTRTLVTIYNFGWLRIVPWRKP